MKIDNRYDRLSDWILKDGKPMPCGFNSRHTIRKTREENGKPIYGVAFYIPGYGVDKVREYKSLAAAKSAITKYDKK